MGLETRILAVDGDIDFLRYIKVGLESFDDTYVVDFAHDAASCLNYLVDYKPHIILINTTLSDVDGFTLRDKIKLTEARYVPMIYLSEGFDLTMTKRVGLLSADDFIAKPINLAELILRIQKLMIMSCYRRSDKRARVHRHKK